MRLSQFSKPAASKLDEQAAKQVAELIVSLAAEGKTDPKKLKALAIAELPRIAPHSL